MKKERGAVWKRELNEELVEAAAFGMALRVRRLMRLGASPAPVPSAKLGGQTRSAVLAAAKSGSVECLRALMELGADMGARGVLHRSAMHEAAMAGKAAAIRELHAIGLSVSEPDHWGMTPLKMAILSGAGLRLGFGMRGENGLLMNSQPPTEFAAAEALIELGANVDEASKEGVTLLTELCAFGNRGAPCVIALLERGADPNAAVDGRGPWEAALGAKKESGRILAELIAAGARPSGLKVEAGNPSARVQAEAWEIESVSKRGRLSPPRSI